MRHLFTLLFTLLAFMLFSASAAVGQAVGNTGCAPQLSEVGRNPKKGNHIRGYFPASDYTVLVEGANDARKPFNKWGFWQSKGKYTSPGQTLKLIDDNGTVQARCCYNANGTLKPCYTCDIQFSQISVALQKSKRIVSWTMAAQSSVINYGLLRRVNGGSWIQVSTILPKSSSSYVAYDALQASGSAEYKVVARCADGSTVMSKSVVVNIP
jgi:hypothetical protein